MTLQGGMLTLSEDTLYSTLPAVCGTDLVKDLVLSAQSASVRYLLVQLLPGEIELTQQELLRMQNVLEDTGSAMVYADFRQEAVNSELCETIDYQLGSVRDDFDFGALVMIRVSSLVSAFAEALGSSDGVCWQYGAWYALRLALSRQSLPFHLNEFLYTYRPAVQEAGSQFDYVNPRNRAVQVEYEQVFTLHLKALGAFIDHRVMKNATALSGAITASVVIPVFNRVKTIQDAIRSALSQQTDFDYNVIVVDNHSTDGTTEVIASLAKEDERVVHIVPEETSLRIGGCWNKAVASEKCGQFVVQLDSDDIYSRPDTLQKMVSAFIEQDCMAVVGSYRLTDFDLQELPPGVIDHREWTPENGMNNALRINGLGAPRGFRRDLLLRHPLPNTSYGEDYAAMLRICREYRIGRIYESLYDCRRWSGNSDAALSREKINRNNLYKDRIRSIELAARAAMLKS